ncbi:Hsp20/alpha crystallin family protein [Spirochaeta isovalerica]|uniref:HSP20 family protein n=1 Tax=Spirochaeta isovalerica TaxID=150 RepID=A0A841RD59_9SPIO|nr:Hsp20/alpha crystallin family protein [Spirochaeta isovalerica]MBB6481321.1 HSP20 family protein [Spirochaeta isovalerica]
MDRKKEIENKKRRFPASTDIFQDEEAVVLTMEMPGVSKENLHIKVDKDLLIIHGERKADEDAGHYRIREIRQGDYYQEYTIDDTIDREKIEATISNGLVTLKLGVKESEKPRKITVQVK